MRTRIETRGGRTTVQSLHDDGSPAGPPKVSAARRPAPSSARAAVATRAPVAAPAPSTRRGGGVSAAERSRRDRIVAAAVTAGKITQEGAADWRRRLDQPAAAAATERLLTASERDGGLVAVRPVSSAGQPHQPAEMDAVRHSLGIRVGSAALAVRGRDEQEAADPGLVAVRASLPTGGWPEDTPQVRRLG